MKGHTMLGIDEYFLGFFRIGETSPVSTAEMTMAEHVVDGDGDRWHLAIDSEGKPVFSTLNTTDAEFWQHLLALGTGGAVYSTREELVEFMKAEGWEEVR